MVQIHARHFVPEKVNENQTGQHRKQNGAGKAFPGFARADAWDHFMFSNKRTHGVSAGVAKLRDENKIKQIIMAIHAREEVDFLNEI